MTDAPDLTRKRELFDAAKDLIDDKAFDAAVLSLRRRWFDALMATNEMEQMKEYRAMIKALEAIPVELTVLINDYKKAVHDAARRQPHG
jgi:hypothetical protein